MGDFFKVENSSIFLRFFISIFVILCAIVGNFIYPGSSFKTNSQQGVIFNEILLILKRISLFVFPAAMLIIFLLKPKLNKIIMIILALLASTLFGLKPLYVNVMRWNAIFPIVKGFENITYARTEREYALAIPYFINVEFDVSKLNLDEANQLIQQRLINQSNELAKFKFKDKYVPTPFVSFITMDGRIVEPGFSDGRTDNLKGRILFSIF